MSWSASLSVFQPKPILNGTDFLFVTKILKKIYIYFIYVCVGVYRGEKRAMVPEVVVSCDCEPLDVAVGM